MRLLNLAMVLAVAVSAGAPIAAGQSVNERANRDEVFRVPKDDPAMAAAMSKARAGLPEFLALAQNPRPGTIGFSVKVAIREGGKVEYFWIVPFASKDGRYSGAINNTPKSVRSVHMGQQITFAQDDIVDWMYFDGAQMKGNFTACALLKHEPKSDGDAFRQRFGLECGP